MNCLTLQGSTLRHIKQLSGELGMELSGAIAAMQTFIGQVLSAWVDVIIARRGTLGAIGGSAVAIAMALDARVVVRWLLLAGALLVAFMAMPLALVPTLSPYVWETPTTLRPGYLAGFAFAASVGALMGIVVGRLILPLLDRLKTALRLGSLLVRESRTDIRSTPVPTAHRRFDSRKYFKKNSIFVGKDSNGKPVHIQQEKWRSCHVQLVGTTGAGKGIAAGVLLTQAALRGEAVVVVDPKDDEFLPHVLGEAARVANRKFFYIDLGGTEPQWSPLQGRNSIEIEEILAGTFGLTDRGTDADFYRVGDRRAARVFANLAHENGSTPSEMATQFMHEHPELVKSAPKFCDDIGELASLPVVNLAAGFNLDNALAEGAVVYIRGSMRSPKILRLQRMFVLSVMQACERRHRETARHVSLFLDEFKYLINTPALEALGAIRDKRAHLILAHQSIGDLRNCPADLDPEAVVAAVTENCAVKIAYRIQDPDTAEWLSAMSGKILIDDEIRGFDTKKLLVEMRSPTRSVRQAERNLIDTNMLQSLPPGCAILYGNGLAQAVHISPVPVKKNAAYLVPTRFIEAGPSTMVESCNGVVSSIAEGMINVD